MTASAAQAAFGVHQAGAAISRAVAQSLEPAAHPLSQFGVEALLAGAVRPRPGALAFADHHDGAHDALTLADLQDRTGACLARLRSFELVPGERVVICAPPGAQSVVMLVAALAAGLEPVLAPMPLPATRQALALAARSLEASALFAPAQFCGVDFEQRLLALAASTPSVRFIGTLSGALDGATDFSCAALSATPAPRARLAEERSGAERPRIGAIDDVGDVHFMSQNALLATTLDLLRATRPQSAAPILSLCAPGSLAALVAGPLAALISGAPLHYLAPFDATRFVETLDALGPSRLVAPALLLPDLANAGLLAGAALRSVAALTPDAAPRFSGAAGCPIIELRGALGVVSLYS